LRDLRPADRCGGYRTVAYGYSDGAVSQSAVRENSVFAGNTYLTPVRGTLSFEHGRSISIFSFLSTPVPEHLG
jgi:hypothetical protein